MMVDISHEDLKLLTRLAHEERIKWERQHIHMPFPEIAQLISTYVCLEARLLKLSLQEALG